MLVSMAKSEQRKKDKIKIKNQNHITEDSRLQKSQWMQIK